MKKKTWKSRIKRACIAAGTYQPFFDSVIDALAGIMEARDNAYEKLKETGGDPIITHTNKGGSTNIVKNPALVVTMEYDYLALAYWKELGLTSKAYKTIKDAKTKFVEEPKKLDSIRSKFKVAK